MKWNEIKKNYPKAFGKMLQWRNWLIINEKNELGHYFTDGVHVVSMFAKFNLRDLYDFFDENALLIQVDCDGCGRFGVSYYGRIFKPEKQTKETFDKQMWNGIVRAFGATLSMDEDFKNAKRINAEKILFTRAFQILETQLNENK